MRRCGLFSTRHHYHLMGRASSHPCGEGSTYAWECCRCGKEARSDDIYHWPGYPRNDVAGSVADRAKIAAARS